MCLLHITKYEEQEDRRTVVKLMNKCRSSTYNKTVVVIVIDKLIKKCFKAEYLQNRCLKIIVFLVLAKTFGENISTSY